MFCPDCGSWNRSALRACVRCTHTLPDVRGPSEVPDALVTALRHALGARYRIVRRVGTGGMAEVYEGRHHVLARRVAVKVLHPHLARDPEMRARFRREAEAASRLAHPFICSPLDYGEVGETVALVQPFLGGGCLVSEVLDGRRVAAPRVARIVAQLATALDYAGRQGVIHRDVKPDNVLFDDDGNAILTDFGIANARFQARLTGGGRAMGTPHYMAPEQAMGRLTDARTDLYALGVMMYECLAGQPPFDGPDGFSIGYKQVHEAPRPLGEVVGDVDPALAAIVMRCLDKAPEARFQRGHDLADALTAWLAAAGATTGARAARPGG